jgi:hypothetical protein
MNVEPDDTETQSMRRREIELIPIYCFQMRPFIKDGTKINNRGDLSRIFILINIPHLHISLNDFEGESGKPVCLRDSPQFESAFTFTLDEATVGFAD